MFKVGDVLAVKAGDDHPRLNKERLHKVTLTEHINGNRFVRTNLTGDEFFYEHRFVLGKTFKGNK